MHHGKPLFWKPHKRYIANSDSGLSIPEEKQVAAVESGSHRFRDDDDDGKVGVCGDAGTFPEHVEGAEGEERIKH